MTALLEINDLTLQLGSLEQPVTAVDRMSLQIKQGEVFALLGESGCGKSMTALSIMRLLPESGRITGGEVLLDGESLLDLPEVEMRNFRGGKIAMIFQEPMTSLNPVMTIGEQIAESVRIHRDVNKEEEKDIVLDLMRDVGIPDVDRRYAEYPHQLSGGMKQRIMIAIALAGEPELLIADEPTTALDVTIQAQVLELLLQLQRDRGMSILLITHDLGVVAEIADRVAVMYAGQVIEMSDIDSFYSDPQHPYSEGLFNSLPDSRKRGQSLSVIKGMVPSLDSHFHGCRFADRCSKVQSVCADQLPPWSGNFEKGYRCHLSEIDADFVPEKADVKQQLEKDRYSFSGEAILTADDLKVFFPIRKGVFRRTVGHVKAVDGVSLQLSPGQTLALVGESGCGKTTVGKGLLQLIDNTGGLVKFNQDEISQLTRRQLRRKRKDFQIIFQDPASSMNPRMLVGDIVAEGLIAQGMLKDKAQRQKRVSELLQQVGLSEDAMWRYPHEFSGGQRQRICIARALAVEPKMIVCDEPTSALDVSVQAQVLNLLKQLQTDLGLAYLFITHDISVVSYLAHEVAVMYLGKIVERGPVEQVLSEPKHPYTRALLSAVPVAEPGKKKKRTVLDGDMPSPAAPPSGCYFHPRCPDATEGCASSYPELIRLDDYHSVNCVLYNP